MQSEFHVMVPLGYRNPLLAADLMTLYNHVCKKNGVRPGKSLFRGKVPKTAPIILCDASAPSFAAKALDWVNRSLGHAVELKAVPSPQDFIPDPLKPVPSGRTPRNVERVRLQSDFLGELGKIGKRPVPMNEDFPRVSRRSWKKLSKMEIAKKRAKK